MKARTGDIARVIAVLLCAGPWSHAADRPSLTIEASRLSQYVWRGLLVTDGPVLQTSSTLAWRGAHLNTFTNQDLNNGSVNELDFDLGYDYCRETLTYSAGAIRYTFPNAPSTTELYAGVASSRRLHPSIRAYFDVGVAKGIYTTLDSYHSLALPNLADHVAWAAVMSAGVGLGSAAHNAYYYGVRGAGIADLHPSFSLPVTYKKMRLTPRLGYNMLLDRALRDGPAPKAHGFFTSIGIAFTL